jgi:hypothetical protein
VRHERPPPASDAELAAIAVRLATRRKVDLSAGAVQSSPISPVEAADRPLGPEPSGFVTRLRPGTLLAPTASSAWWDLGRCRQLLGRRSVIAHNASAVPLIAAPSRHTPVQPARA